jgi:hypothetical protein
LLGYRMRSVLRDWLAIALILIGAAPAPALSLGAEEPEQQSNARRPAKSKVKQVQRGGSSSSPNEPSQTGKPNPDSRRTAPPNRQETPPPPQDESHTVRNVGIAAGSGAAAAVVIALLARNAPMSKLNRNGPEFSELIQMSAFSVKGFVKGGWPLVIDYDSRPGTHAVLTVALEDRSSPPYTEVLPVTSTQRNILRFGIPQQFGSDPKIANFSVRATIGPNNPELAYFRVYGFGCGPRAVGSVAIDRLTFAPDRISSATPTATIGFHARTNFDKVNAEFMQIETVQGCIQGKVFDDMPIKDTVRREETVSDNWNGKKARPGQIQFRVRGWMNLKNGGDWVSAFSPNVVIKQ